MVKKSVCWVFIIFLIIIPLINSAQTVVVNEPKTPEKKDFFASTFGFLGSPIFWYVMIGFILIIVVLVGIFFLVRWLVKFLKSRSDIFYNMRSDRIKLAKVQGRYVSKHWYKVHKNTPIRLVKNENGKPVISSPFAFHRGDYVTHEGNVIICMNLKENKKWLFFPITDLLIIPNKEKLEIKRKNEKGKEETIYIENLPKAENIVQFNENEILIYAENVSAVGVFYVPVLKAIDGKIIDLSVPVYQSLKEVALGDYLYSQSDSFVKTAKKSIDLNPNLRYQTKVQDSSGSVEIPQGENRP